MIIDDQISEKCELYSDIPDVLTVSEVGKFLGIGRNTAYGLVRSNKIAVLRIGRQIRISKHSFLQYLGVTASQ